MGIWSTFRDFKGRTQLVLIVSFAFGTVLFYLLWTADINYNLKVGNFDPQRPSWLQRHDADWLQEHTYVANILTTATGFLMGAPFAVTILAAFTIERENKAELRNVNTLTALAWKRYRDSVLMLCNDQRIDTLNSLPPRTREIYEQVHGCFARYHSCGAARFRESMPNPQWRTTEDEYDRLKECLEPLKPEFQRVAIAEYEASGLSDKDLQAAWASILANWNTLEQYIKLRRLELHLGWINDDLYGPLSALMTRNGNPIRRFTELHEANIVDLRPGIQTAYLTTIWYSEQLSKAELDDRISKPDLQAPELFFKSGEELAAYVQIGMDSANFLTRMRDTVNEIDDLNWPATATTPIEPT